MAIGLPGVSDLVPKKNIKVPGATPISQINPSTSAQKDKIPKTLGDLFGFSEETQGVFGALSNSLSEIAAGFGADVKQLQLGRSLEDARKRIAAFRASGKKDDKAAAQFTTKLIGDFETGAQGAKQSKEKIQQGIESILPASSINNTMFG